jgi:hypothetical protein
METSFQAPFGLILDDVNGLPGVLGRSPIRLTRPADQCSILLHPITDETSDQLAGVSFETSLPDFRVPFVSKIVGLLEHQQGKFLIEPLPAAVPLAAAWRHLLVHAPVQAPTALRGFARQFNQIENRLGDLSFPHGAVVLENAILTASGTCGLLQARLPVDGGSIWLRPPATVGAPGNHQNTGNGAEDAKTLLLQLAAVAFASGLRDRALTREIQILLETAAENSARNESDNSNYHRDDPVSSAGN